MRTGQRDVEIPQQYDAPLPALLQSSKVDPDDAATMISAATQNERTNKHLERRARVAPSFLA